MHIDVYKFEDPREFLLEVFETSKKDLAKFSIRKFAQNIGLNTHTSLYQMMKGDRKIPINTIRGISNYLKLGPDESAYLDLINALSLATTEAQRHEIKEGMKFLSKKNVQEITVIDDFEIQKSPLYSFILELIDLSPLINNPELIQKKLCHNFNTLEIDTMVKLLLDRKFILLTKDNYLVKGPEKYFFSKQDQKNIALRMYHKKLCDLAAASIDMQAIEDREYNGVALNVDYTKLPEIKLYLRDVVKDFIARFSDPHSINSTTYQLNTHLFKVTNTSKESNHEH